MLRASAERTAGASGRPVKGVNILVRVRPTLPREIGFDNAVEVLSDKEVVVFKRDAEFASTYDCVLPEETTQEQIYAQLQGSIHMALQGYNGTIFAYGQTGTGKTYTMLGPPGVDLTAAVTHAPQPGQEPAAEWSSLGVIPRALSDLFREAALRSSREDVRIQVVASYMEIYNDRLFDLLQPYKKGMGTRDPSDMVQRKALLEVREDKAGNTYVPNLLCVKVNSLAAVMALVAKGNRHRAVRHTEMNVTSSRSHAILQLVIEQWPGQGQGHGHNSKPSRAQAGTVLRSKLNFVDLAGSERWNKEVDMMVDRVNELTAINGSLSALATVVAALTEGRGRKHVPYRDSKLTHLLQDSLGGNCLTSIVATVSPSVDAFDETVSTLKFADRASAIANNPVVNTSRDMGSVLALKEREIARLRQMLAAYMQGTNPDAVGAEAGTDPDAIPPSASGVAAAEQLMQELESVRRALEMERQLRTELEARLQAAAVTATGEGGEPSPERAGSSPLLLPSAQQQVQPATQFDYLRVVTPSADTGSGMPSPELQRVYRQLPPGSSLLDSSSGDPFKAVMSRRAQLGLGGSPSAAGHPASSGGASALYRGMSPARRSGSAAPTRPVATAWGAPVGSSSSASPLRGSVQRSGLSHASALEDAIARIRQQVQELTVLENHNKQRARIIAHATRSARGAGSPMARNKAKLRNIYNSPVGLSAYKPGTGVSQQRLHTGSSVSQYAYGGVTARRGGSSMGGAAGATLSRPMNDSSFDQLLAAAHASVNDPQNSAAAVAISRVQQLQAQQQALHTQQQSPQTQQQHLPLHTASSMPTPPAGGWGRSAILSKFSDSPTEPAQQWMPKPQNSSAGISTPSSSSQQQSQLSPSGSSVPAASSGWGRSALLAAGASASGSTPPAQTALSAPASSGGGGWGRSGLLGSNASPARTDSHNSTPYTGSGSYAMHMSPTSSNSVQARPKQKPPSPARFSPGSMIYILGASASSIRAKQMASSFSGGIG